MNNLLIPPSPNWYESSILACAPDNTLLYGSRSELVVIRNVPLDKPGDITLIPRAHSERIKCVVINPSWGNPEKLAVTVSEDKIVRLWDIELMTSPHSHNAHTVLINIIGATFAGNDKVVSVSENGFIVIWRLGTNEITSLKDLLGTKVKVSCISSCPHAPWLTAFGLKSGLILLTDLKKSGKILYRLRGHDRSIVSLSWCPVPVNIFPPKSIDKKQNRDSKPLKEEALNIKEVVEIKINNTEAKENVQDTKPKIKLNPWVGLKHADDDEIQEEPEIPPVKVLENDFLVECELLKGKIAEINEDNVCEKVYDGPKNEDLPTENYENNETSVENNKTNNDPEIILNDDIIKENKETESFETTEKGIDNDEKEAELIEKNETSDSENNFDAGKEVKYSKEFLLASSSRGGPLFIWRAGTDGGIQSELWMSNMAYQRKVRSSEKNFIAVNWITPNILLSSSTQGELLKWDLLAKKIQPKIVHNDHSNILFSIAAPVQILQEYVPAQLQDDSNLHAWTVGLDRYLLDTKLGSDRKTLISYPTFGGFANCFKSSPFDPTRIAIGVSDGTTNMWDLSRENLQCVTMVKVWQRMQSSVTAIAWHPTKESMLAYGTQEGRIGLINSIIPAKPPTLLTKYFRTPIYRMDWGPLAADKKTFGLYVCAAGKLAVYDISNLLENPTLIEIEDSVTEVTWKNDYSIMAVGTKFSSIFIFNSDLKLVTKLYLQQKSIYYLVWHPDATVEDEGKSKFRFWLAAGITDANIFVCDLSDIDLNRTDVEYNSKKFIIRRLQGHSKTVRDICWSPHEEAKLASAGEDGLVQVWDVKNDTLLSTFLGHNSNAVMSLIWSPADKNYIISSSKDNTIRIWNVTEHPPHKDTEKKIIQKTKADVKKVANQKEQENVEVKPKKIARDLMMQYTCKMQCSPYDLEIIKCLANLNETEEKPINDKNEESTKEKPEALKLFGDRNDMTAILEYEQNRHKEKSKFVCAQHLSLWKGDLNETLKEAIEKNAVTPWLISLAPMVSPKLWSAACECYAKKLTETENSDPFETASYYLACHKVEDAIEVLYNATFYREALAIAKCRLSPSDPLINEILLKWSQFCYSTGNYEIAAQCFAALEKYEDAAKVLSKRSDLKTLQLSMKLAEKSENKDLLNAIAFQCNSFDKNETEVVDLPSRIQAFMYNKKNEFTSSSPQTEHTLEKGLNEDTESQKEEVTSSSMDLTCIDSPVNLEPITISTCDMELTCEEINNSEFPKQTEQTKADE